MTRQPHIDCAEWSLIVTLRKFYEENEQFRQREIGKKYSLKRKVAPRRKT